LAVKIRLRRLGRKKRPFYRIIAADSRSPRDGKFIEEIGFYDPLTEPATVNVEEDRIMYWLGVGAEPSKTVKNILSRQGIILKFDLQRKGVPEEKISEELKKWEVMQIERVRRIELKKTEAAEAKKKAKEEAEAEKAESEKAEAKATEKAKAETIETEEPVEESKETETSTEKSDKEAVEPEPVKDEATEEPVEEKASAEEKIEETGEEEGPEKASEEKAAEPEPVEEPEQKPVKEKAKSKEKKKKAKEAAGEEQDTKNEESLTDEGTTAEKTDKKEE